MSISVQLENKEFHLYNDEISYIMHLLPNGHIGHLYYGKRVSEKKSYQHLFQGVSRPLGACVFDDDDTFSLHYTKQEYACYGTTDFGLPAFSLRQSDGSTLSDFKYREHRVLQGKPHIKGLPHTYTNDDLEAQTLEIILEDNISSTILYLYYTIFEKYPVITRHASFEQIGQESVSIEKAMSICLDLPDSVYEWMHLDGAWGRERHLITSKLQSGNQSIYSLKGASSSEHNPFIALKRPYTTEDIGEAIGCSLVYSGNFYAGIDVKTHGISRLLMGIHSDYFCWELKPNERFDTPEVVLVYSDCGLNKMSQIYHAFYREHLIRGTWKEKPRPVLLNNWEAMSFDFDESSILALVDEAKQVGMELFVLDDGWFGHRNHDASGLGDWTVNKEKLPNGLESIISHVHSLDMMFGLWIEPEMVNKDSLLYREHPDWIVHHPNRRQSPSRHQHTLDLSREDVYQNIYKQLHTLLSTNQIDYIKWDMNRYMTETYSLYYDARHQGELFHRYILNVYRLYEALTTEFPHVLFESCASGGARFDAGMLYYAPQTWTSDNTDAIERLFIQYGTSMVYPLVSMGCHVSEVPNQQVNRVTPLHTRANVAFFGNFGYELDLSKLTVEEKNSVREHIQFYKTYRDVFQKGTFYRLLSPYTDIDTAWQVISEDKKTVIVGYYQQLTRANRGFRRFVLKGVSPEKMYQCQKGVFYGNELMCVGLPIDNQEHDTDFSSVLYVLKEIEE
ncbi:alpha-galactosidase [Carnobacteriaceae bacterium zg-ZUI78]|nr:alpha-galactosidase [Carnobacteriaceae bacterium zg-ZUI78]